MTSPTGGSSEATTDVRPVETHPRPEEPMAASGAVLSHVAHELRTPLTAILGILELLEDSTVPLDPNETAELVRLARDDAET